MKKVLRKAYNMIFIVACILCTTFIFNFTLEVHASDTECSVSTCAGEYVNGFCNTCNSYQQPMLVDGYYLITNAGELYWFRNQIAVNGNINGKLLSNIIINEGNISGSGGNKQAGWRTWINDDTTYRGTFDGNGFYVSGIYSEFNIFNGAHGFFGRTDGARIQNLSILNSYFKNTSGFYLGAFVGYSKYGSFENCYFEGIIEVNVGTNQGGYVGGMVGLSADSSYKGCIVKSTVNLKSSTDSIKLGGMIGSSYYGGGSFKNCLADATLNINDTVQSVGALIGNNRSYTHDNTYYNSTKYAIGMQGSYNSDTVIGITTDDITGGIACTNLGNHKYKSVVLEHTHYQECMLCGSKTAEEAHNQDYPATCLSTAICGICGIKHGEYDLTNHVSNEFDENGFSVCCGNGYEPIVLVTDSNYTELGLSSEYIGYYAISNAGQLFDYSYKFANDNKNYSNAKLVLTKDINVNPGYTFNSDGTVSYNGTVVTSGWRHWERIYFDAYYVSENFTGIFDGNYHTISGLYVNDENLEYVGLFGEISGAEIYNLGIINSYFYANRKVGGFAGTANFNSIIKNCYSEVTVSSTYGAAGFVSSGASNTSGTAVTIENCYFNGVVKPRNSSIYMSGLYGSDNGTIINSYFNKTKSSYGKTAYAKTEEQFKSGEVAYLLNGDQSEIIYGQTLGGENFPTFGGKQVYGGYDNCEATTMSFTNDANHKLNATTGHKWEYSANGNTITATCVQPTCSIEDRTETIEISALDKSELTFNDSPKTVNVNESTVGLIPYEVVYTDSENTVLSEAPKEIGVYTATITIESATISVTYEITKSILESTPIVKVEYGRNHEDVNIESKVYIKGTNYEVEGIWEWITGTKTAKFVPTDTNLHNIIESVTVEIEDIAEDPVIVLTSPVNNINPGQSVYLNVNAYNKYNNQEVDLPTEFTYTYRIGTTGVENVFIDGLLAVPNNAPIGSTIYVTVKSAVVENKYNSGSATIEISVTGTSGTVMIGENGNWYIDGQDTRRPAQGTIIAIGENGNWFLNNVDTGKKVDYTKDIEAINELLNQEVARLQGLIESNDTKITEINESIKNINSAIEAAKVAAQNANNELQTLLEGKLQEAEAALTQAIKDLDAKLDQAIKDLEAADKANTDALAQAIVDLTDLIEAAKVAAQNANNELQTLLEGKLQEAEAALTQAIKDLEAKLDQAIKDLEAADKANTDALAQAIVDLTDLIEAAKVAAQNANNELQTLLEGKLQEAEAALTQAIKDLDAKLDQAIKDLEAADKANTDALAQAIVDLTDLVEAAKVAAQNANNELQTLLEGKLQEAEAALTQAIKDLDAKLDQAIKDLEAADKANTDALAQAIVDLTDLIEAAKQAARLDNIDLQIMLEGKLDQAEAILEESIGNLKSELAQNVKELIDLIENTDETNDKNLSEAIANLKTLIETVEKSGIEANEVLKEELESIQKGLKSEIESLKQALKEAIQNAEQENKDLETKLNNADSNTKSELLAEIKTSIILPTVIGSISLAGNVALSVYIIIKRKK